MKILYFFMLFCLLLVSGCSTPEGGSSLPWSQPEAWENQMPVGADY